MLALQTIKEVILKTKIECKKEKNPADIGDIISNGTKMHLTIFSI